LSHHEFKKFYRSFLAGLATNLRDQVDAHRDRVSEELMNFWERVLEECRR